MPPHGPVVIAPLVALAFAAGCGPRPEPTLAPADGTLPPDLVPAAEVVRRDGLDPSANGLECLTWSVLDDEAAIAAAFRRHGLRERDPVAEAGIDREALRREGLRLEAVREESLIEFLAELGGTSVALSVWHGQAIDWRELARRPVNGSLVVMTDGRPRRLDAGWLRLLVRGWTLPLEDGAVSEASLELRWSPDTPEASRVSIARPTRRPESQRLLGPFRVEIPRETCLLILARPPEDPAGSDGDAPSRPETEASGARAGTAGPPADLPQTLGETLLREPGEPPRRTLLVLRPRLPDILFPAVVRIGGPSAKGPPPPPAGEPAPR